MSWYQRLHKPCQKQTFNIEIKRAEDSAIVSTISSEHLICPAHPCSSHFLYFSNLRFPEVFWLHQCVVEKESTASINSEDSSCSEQILCTSHPIVIPKSFDTQKCYQHLRDNYCMQVHIKKQLLDLKLTCFLTPHPRIE